MRRPDDRVFREERFLAGARNDTLISGDLGPKIVSCLILRSVPDVEIGSNKPFEDSTDQFIIVISTEGRNLA